MLGWARNFSNNRADSSGAWIWRHRSGIDRNCQVLVLSVPGDVRDLLCLRLERKKSSMISGRLDRQLWIAFTT